MALFGVKVILFITGVVKTNFLENDRLPENSLYEPAKATIEEILPRASPQNYEASVDEQTKAV